MNTSCFNKITTPNIPQGCRGKRFREINFNLWRGLLILRIHIRSKASGLLSSKPFNHIRKLQKAFLIRRKDCKMNGRIYWLRLSKPIFKYARNNSCSSLSKVLLHEVLRLSENYSRCAVTFYSLFV